MPSNAPTPGGVSNRLINAMQLARDEHELSDAVVEENCERLQQMHLEQAAQMRPAMIRMGLAGVLILVGLGFWIASPDEPSNAATRILGTNSTAPPQWTGRNACPTF